MSVEIKIPRKLIEVALPLDAINIAAVREKSIRHGHPSSLHLWWARRPLAVARAMIFAQMVNDPGFERSLGRGVNKEQALKDRERLFKLMERLVQWEATNDHGTIEEARNEIRKSWRETCTLNRNHPQAAELFDPEKLPSFHDPFAGGGAIPLEAQRLGLSSFASDLNQVSVLINKAMIEIPPKFAGRAPVNPDAFLDKQLLEKEWPGASGLAEDVQFYGELMRKNAHETIGHLFPQIEFTSEVVENRKELKQYAKQKLNVIAWLWTRTVKSPNPAFSHVDVPIASSFVLSAKAGKEAFLEPIVSGDSYSFKVNLGTGKAFEKARLGTTAGKRNGFICLISQTPIDYDYVRAEGKAGRIGARLMAVVVEGDRGRVYIPGTREMESVARSAKPIWKPEMSFFQQALGFRVGNYGMTKWSDLFTPRQTVALTTFCDLVEQMRDRVKGDAVAAGKVDDGIPLAEGGTGISAYADSIAVYLAFQVDQLANHLSEMCAWHVNNEQLKNTFARQTLSMTWDYAETNPFSNSTGSLGNLQERQVKGILSLAPNSPGGLAVQADAAEQTISQGKVVSTDPPYYDNIGYADLSDFFYVWLRRSLLKIMPSALANEAVPKLQELVATPDRHGGKEKAESFFLSGMTKAMERIGEQAHPAFPVTIYYAFKQSETDNSEGTSSTGWETFLAAVIKAGFAITGTWPMRTEQTAALKTTRNALASSIVLVCSKRLRSAPTVSRREFIRELNTTLPEALVEMTSGTLHSPVAPVDLSQAIIGPGMAVFTKYSAVLEADGKPMSVKTALQLINRFFAEEDFDHDSQFCLKWFEEHGWEAGQFGEADVLARAKGTSVEGLKEAGVVVSSAGSLRLLKPSELSPQWKPETDSRVSVWELLHHMVARFNSEGESGAGELLSRAGSLSETIRTLAYRLYTLCERQKWAQDAGHYDALVRAWDSIESAARSVGYSGTQISLFGIDQNESAEKAGSKKKTRKRS